MNNFTTRTLFGSLYVVLILASVLIHQWLFLIVFFFLMMMSLNEFVEKGATERKHSIRLISLSAAAITYIIVSLVSIKLIPYFCVFLLIPLPGLIFSAQLFSSETKPFQVSGFVFMGLLYIALPFSLMTMMFNPVLGFEKGIPDFILSVFILIWINDSAAYLVGRFLGRHKLLPAVSPAKTWEGSIGGIVFSLIAAYLMSVYFPVISRQEWMIMAALIAVCAIVGDLIESLFKRSLGLKDFGDIMPGHGGFLDRLDSILFTIPFVYIYLLIILS